MKFEKFKSIVEYNQSHQEEIIYNVKDLYLKTGMDYENRLLNVMQIVRPVFRKEKYFALEIPFKDSEIGAICYRGDAFGYMFLNSALPKVNVNFALCHEVYHILYQEKIFSKKIELYMNENYSEQENERSANCFAGILLMPEVSFINMFRKFAYENREDDTNMTIIVKLMNYFEVPYMAVVIRCYELKLLEQGEVLEQLLDVTNDIVKKEFLRLWLNEDILKPTKKDDYLKLEAFVKEVGMIYKERDILSERTISKALENMQKVYNEIRG